ncbi:hypothetical protein JL193_11225 [Polaribacter batillariae]|uniref:Lipoprotein n=1 Tax=Polaribacter batillariae TaxID=2808900 RepID=A0ABX7STR5_9FLAO|nr:hypothetical protein [Polaribacter batillariae]QTD36708.1 hypothetical protein JL193_11225 [Polaribacter batillariae]
MMKTTKKITVLFLFLCISILFSCSSNEKDNNNCETCTYTIAADETAGNVPTALQGEFNLTLGISLNGYSKPKGTKAKFIIGAKELTVEIDGEECLFLKNPTVSANGVEFSFKDTCRDNFLYAISEKSSGGLNEVNVVTLDGQFYGQFK